ncbi:flavodoxin [Sporosarcina jiandibaonis]|uniref:flavodoxin n=1 Tax=Sporosarcina jiandibaonis TaxID=2715535 RepID=UPI003CCDA90E
MSFLIAYATWSGNTEEVAELIEAVLLNSDLDVTRYRIGTGPIPDVNEFDALIIGSFTWDKGATPDEVKDFAAEVGYKPPNVYVFGTGDTQFGGDELFCNAAVKLARFYESKYAPLKIEQSPRGTQEIDVINWTEGVIKQWAH